MTGMQWMSVLLAAMGGFTLGLIWAGVRRSKDRTSEVLEIGSVGPYDLLVLTTTGTLTTREADLVKTASEDAWERFSAGTDKPMVLVLPRGMRVQIVRNYRNNNCEACQEELDALRGAIAAAGRRHWSRQTDDAKFEALLEGEIGDSELANRVPLVAASHVFRAADVAESGKACP